MHSAHSADEAARAAHKPARAFWSLKSTGPWASTPSYPWTRARLTPC